MAEMQSDNSNRLKPDFGSQEEAMQSYFKEGEKRASELGNRGPIRFKTDGSLDQSIIDAYQRCGFYVFTGVLGQEELKDVEKDVLDMLERAPVDKGAKVDAKGRPALGMGNKGLGPIWVKPLSDPLGGTDSNGGRHPVKMSEPTPGAGAPEYVLQLILGYLQYSDACLRVYAHPQLLSVVAQLNGEDFTPFNEALWFKYPGLGGSVAWHQDGTTQWDRPDFDSGTHGFNVMAQLYGCTAANGLWVVPGSHHGKADIKAMCKEAGSERLPDAVPLICEPGDVAFCNRQAVHGSFANTSEDLRVSITFGFHRRSSVLGASGNGIHSEFAVYDEERIFERSKMIAYAIDARRQRFPDEQSYHYKPFAGMEDEYRYNEEAKGKIKDYNTLDLGI